MAQDPQKPPSLVEQQDRLHSEGQQVLDELALIPELQKYGKPNIVGSFELGLLTRRDIDIEVVVDSLDKKQVQGLCSYLAAQPLPRIDLTVMDNTINRNPHLPNSLYIGVIYRRKGLSESELSDRSLAWQLDIHFLKSEDSKGGTKTKDVKDKLTPETRLAILEIKQNIATNPKYHKEVFSVDIYDAILDQGITDVEGFKDYMREKGVEL